MKAPLYKDFLMPRELPTDGHAGLWYDRFFNQYDKKYDKDGHDDWKVSEDGKKKWIKGVTHSVEGVPRPIGGNSVKEFALRQKELVGKIGGTWFEASTTWHFTTGLGNPHPVENGFAWHPTLGVPYLTGAAVKGMFRAWCEVWLAWKKESPDLDDPRLKSWFGDTNSSGALIFFDAIPTGPVQMIADIMTPHYGDWYQEGGKIKDAAKEPENIPADWHSPVPIPFLAVGPKTEFLFSFAVCPSSDVQVADVAYIMRQLQNALESIGTGAKTAVGYGLFKMPNGVSEEAPTQTTSAPPPDLFTAFQS
jgi:CRISPR-associated protein Cmr6